MTKISWAKSAVLKWSKHELAQRLVEYRGKDSEGLVQVIIDNIPYIARSVREWRLMVLREPAKGRMVGVGNYIEFGDCWANIEDAKYAAGYLVYIWRNIPADILNQTEQEKP